jgi:hypothetical protein
VAAAFVEIIDRRRDSLLGCRIATTLSRNPRHFVAAKYGGEKSG